MFPHGNVGRIKVKFVIPCSARWLISIFCDCPAASTSPKAPGSLPFHAVTSASSLSSPEKKVSTPSASTPKLPVLSEREAHRLQKFVRLIEGVPQTPLGRTYMFYVEAVEILCFLLALCVTADTVNCYLQVVFCLFIYIYIYIYIKHILYL